MRNRLLIERTLALALLTTAAALPAAAARQRPALRDTPRPALRALRGNASLAAPAALLYVSRRCGHCAPVAARFDSLVTALGVRGIVIAGEPAESTAGVARWAAAAGVRRAALALDTGHVLARALVIRAVPALVAISPSSVVSRYDLRAMPSVLATLERTAP